MAINAAKYEAVARGYTRIFRTRLRRQPVLFPRLCTYVDSNSIDEKYGWLGDVPQMKEFLGSRTFDQLRSMDYTLKNKTWEQSLGLERHVIDDDRYQLYNTPVARLAAKAARHPDVLLADLVVNGESNECYDGQNFYSAAHVEGDSGTQSNLLSFTVASVTDVTVSEFKDAFTQAFLKFFEYKTDQGDLYIEPLAVNPGNLIILVPLTLWDVANKAMNQLIAAEGSNGAATTNILLTRATVLPFIRMGAAFGGNDAMFDLLYTGDEVRPFVFQDRASLETLIKGAGDIEEKLIKIMTEARYNLGYGLWQHAIRTKFSV